MQLDRKALERLLSMNDTQLKMVIQSIAASSGIDLASLGITDSNIASIRKALSGATDEDIKKASEQLEKYSREKRRGQ